MESALLSESEYLDFAVVANEQPAINRPDKDSLSEHWQQVKNNLHDFCVSEFTDHTHFTAAREQVIETANVFAGSLSYSDMFTTAFKSEQDNIPWTSQKIGYDQVLQADLITLHKNCGTPIHSYNGAAGWLVVISGELTVTRYREMLHYDNDVNLLSKLEPVRSNRYHSGDATLVDSISAPILELKTRTQRCVLINFHLRDHNDLEHYFYFPTYRNRNEETFFSRRVDGEI